MRSVPIVLKRLLPFCLALSLSGCIDIDVTMDFKDSETAEVTVAMEMSREFYDLTGGGKGQGICPKPEQGSKADLVVGEKQVTCRATRMVKVADMLDGKQGAGKGIEADKMALVERIDDDTLSLQASWVDEARGHEWLTTVGRSETRVRDHFEPGWSIFSANTTVDDDVRQTHHTLDSRLQWALWRNDANDHTWTLRTGLQLDASEREARRVTGNAMLNTMVYPQGYNQAQPPGEKRTTGAYLQLVQRWQRWEVLPGLRWDRTEVSVRGASADLLQAVGQATSVQYAQASPSLTLSYALQPQRWTTFATVARSHRPPPACRRLRGSRLT